MLHLHDLSYYSSLLKGIPNAMAFKIVATLLTVKLFIASTTEYSHTIYVDPVSGSNTTACLTDNDASQPCRNLSYAFQYRNHSTQYLLHPGTHYLNSIASDSPFTDLEEIAIRGNTNTAVGVVIECTGRTSGLLFFNTRNLEIESITFCNCATIRRDAFGFNVTHTTWAGIHFYACSAIHLTSITVASSGGTGVALYDSTGTINVVNSTFSYNGFSESGYGGGGLYIESSISLPVQYMLQDSIFRGNRGNHNPTENPTDRGLSCRFGGGLAIYLIRSATNHSMKVCECTFVGNEVSNYGGGMCIGFADNALGNSIVVDNSTFEENLAWGVGGSGGALHIGHYIISHGDDAEEGKGGNRVDITHSWFMENYAQNGGALSISPSRQMSALDEKLLSVYLSSCHFEGNKAQSGAALFIALHPLTVQGKVPAAEIHNSSFVANEINENNFTTGVGAVYIDKIPVQFRKEVRFENNRGSGLGVVGAVVDFSDCKVHFLSNVGDKGGAIALLGNARIMVNSMTCMNFSNNLALVQGGAIYNRYIEKEDMRNYADCFVHHQDPFASPEKWNATFNFNGNSGALGGDAIHSTSIFPCTLGGNISEVFRWKGWTYSQDNSSSLISSDVGYIEVNNSLHLKVIAGEIFSLPLGITDDLGCDILDETVFTVTSSNDSAAQVDPRFTYATGKAMKVNGRENSAFVLNLRSTGDRVWHIELPIEVQSCPPGFELRQNTSGFGQCECSGDYGGRVRCNQNKFTARLQNAFWMGFSPEHNDTLTVSLCLPGFCYRDPNKPYLLLPNASSDLDAYICGQNHRTGILCGECEAGYGPAVNSKTYECVHCNNTNIAANATYYILSVYLPLFVLFLAIILFNIKLTTGPANAFILYSQVISSTFDLNADGHIPIYLISSQTDTFLKAYRFIYGIFNLEFLDSFLSPFCLGTNLNALDVLQLDYLIAFFPLLMIALVIGLIRLKSYFTCRCFQRLHCLPRSFSIGSSLTHAFTAFLLLSYTNFSLASSYIVNIHLLLGDNGQQVGERRVYFAGQFSASDTTYLIRYYIPAILVFVIFTALPPFLLLDYPLRVLEAGVNRVSWLRRFYPSLKIKIILDSFQGCFRLNMRFFAGIYFLFRLAINVSYILTDTWLQQFTVQQVLCILLILLVALFRPYKKKIFNYVDLLIFTNLTLLNLLSLHLFAYAQINPGQSLPLAAFVLQGILVFLPLLYMIAYLLWLGTFHYHPTIRETLMKQWLIKKCLQRVAVSPSHNLNNTGAQDYQLWDDSFCSLGPSGAPTSSVVDVEGRDREFSETDIFLSRAQAPNRYKRANSVEEQEEEETPERLSD